MARLSREFVKLETRILNDYRFFTMSEFEQLVFIKLLGISRSTSNQIPKKTGVVGELLRTKRSVTEVKSAIKQIKFNFPKFKENKYFYYFEDYELRLNNSAPKKPIMGCVDEDEDEDVDEDEDKTAASPALKTVLDKIYNKGNGLNIYALMNKLKKQLGWPADRQFPEEVLLKVCATYDKGQVKDEWAWFTTAIRKASEEWFAEQNIKENTEFKKQGMPQVLKDILGMR